MTSKSLFDTYIFANRDENRRVLRDYLVPSDAKSVYIANIDTVMGVRNFDNVVLDCDIFDTAVVRHL